VVSDPERADRPHSPRRSRLTPIRRLRSLAALALALALAFLVAQTTATSALDPATVLAPGLSHGPIQPEKSAPTAKTSKNWAGFAVTGTSFTDVTGSWVQPMVPVSGLCPAQQQDAAFWVGMDGFSSKSKTVEQIGTDSDCNKASKKGPGVPHYYAWWQIAPQPSVNLATSCPTCQVSPGDSMTAQVSANGSSYTLTLRDNSVPWTFSTTQTSAAAQASSVEWITEDPLKAAGSSVGKLADFGSVTFSGLTISGIHFSGMVQITMKNRASATLQSTSSFRVDWLHN